MLLNKVASWRITIHKETKIEGWGMELYGWGMELLFH